MKSDNFTSFLRELGKGAPGSGGTARSVGAAKILTLLIKGPQPHRELVLRSNLEFLEFLDAVEYLKQHGLVRVTGAAGAQDVELTDEGRRAIESFGS